LPRISILLFKREKIEKAVGGDINSTADSINQ
jgi:hypothetical protein